MNNCSFIGRVGKDAAVKYTQGGKAVAGWSLAVDSGYGQNKATIWLDCTLWGERGEKIAQYITKGAQLGVTGELGAREHDGKTYLTLRIDNATLIGSRSEGERPQGPQRAPSKPQKSAPVDDGFDDSDIPF